MMKASVFKPVAPSNSGAYPVRQSNGGSATRRLHRKQAAEFLGVSLSWLDKARISGLGPVFHNNGRSGSLRFPRSGSIHR